MLGYPEDPNIYFIKGNEETLQELKELTKAVILPGNLTWPFTNVEVIPYMPYGYIEFGPEQIVIKKEGIK